MKQYSSQLLALLLFAASSVVVVEAFTPTAVVVAFRPTRSLATTVALSAVAEGKEAVFAPLDEDDDEDGDVLDKVEMLGKGAAKVGQY
jgi:hypothetical protein